MTELPLTVPNLLKVQVPPNGAELGTKISTRGALGDSWDPNYSTNFLQIFTRNIDKEIPFLEHTDSSIKVACQEKNALNLRQSSRNLLDTKKHSVLHQCLPFSCVMKFGTVLLCSKINRDCIIRESNPTVYLETPGSPLPCCQGSSGVSGSIPHFPCRKWLDCQNLFCAD
jgi:hypothetical protein